LGGEPQKPLHILGYPEHGTTHIILVALNYF
jgi:hypothetical protein